MARSIMLPVSCRTFVEETEWKDSLET